MIKSTWKNMANAIQERSFDKGQELGLADKPIKVMRNIALALGAYQVPNIDFSHTNLHGTEGEPITKLDISHLEKIILMFAGFKRPHEFIHTESGELSQSPVGLWQFTDNESSLQLTFDEYLTRLLQDGQTQIGIRISQADSIETQPSRPFQKVNGIDHPGLVKNTQDQIIGINTDNKDGSYSQPYHFQSGDKVELFIQPSGDMGDNGQHLAGGFKMQLRKNNTYQVELTTGGFDIRDHVKPANRERITGKLKQALDQNTHPIIASFFETNRPAIKQLRQAIKQKYPKSKEIVFEAHYAYVNGQLIIYVFDFEIPEKTAAQWLNQEPQKREKIERTLPFYDGYNQELLAPTILETIARYEARLRPGD